MRSRAVPCGTVGGRIGGHEQSLARERCGDRDRFRARPDHERLDRGVRRQQPPAPELQALAAATRPGRAAAAGASPRARRARGLSMSAHGEERRRRGRVDVWPRALDERFHDLRPRRRRKRRTRPPPCRASPCRRCAASAAPKCASTPRPRAPSTPKPCASSSTSQASWRSASARRSRHRRDVAVHAEYRVGDDELAPRARSGQQAIERGEIEVGIAPELRAREQRRVVQGRVVQPVGEHRVAARRERGHDAEVRRGSRSRRAAPRGSSTKRASALLERVMRGAVPEDEMRRAGADAVALRALARRCDRAPDARRARGNRCCRTRRSRARPPRRARPAATPARAACASGRVHRDPQARRRERRTAFG